MRKVDINELGSENFNPIFINALRQFWRNTNSFQCIGNPKKQNLLLFVSGCRITYTDKNGEVCVANGGEVVYTPLGSEYKAVLSDFASKSSHTVGINFLLTDQAGEGVVLSEGIRIFRPRDPSAVAALFDRAALGDGGELLSNRIALMEILACFTDKPQAQSEDAVSVAASYLAENIEKNPSVTQLARVCNVSEVYLRRIFKEAMGVSPAKYRNELRLNKAVSYLKFGDISVQEISDALGYATVSHFIKEFKGRFGVSPLQYRKRQQSS